ncbi:MAG TPA: gamma-glutamylcyclotransferase family protein [Stellaceae bacterium]|nr:gamma-glutamylcyclotransferase family protein [Stellaceae bacterium]
MEPARIDVFFYGLFMDAQALRAMGLDPVDARPARVRDKALRIGKRAALVASPPDVCHGVVMRLTPAEVERLYAEPSVAMYRPEPVTAELATGSTVAAVCYNLPVAPAAEETNPAYAGSLRELARRLGLPQSYIDTIR